MKSNMKTLVEEIWELIINYSFLLKDRYKEKFDGKEYWKQIKPFLIEINNRTIGYKINYNPNHKNIINKFKNYLSEIPEKNDNNELIEKNHFLLQQLNIPKKDKGIPSFQRLLQIALNIGQLKPYIDSFPNNIKKLIGNNNLDDIKTYMTPNNYNKFLFDRADYNKLKIILDKQIQFPSLKPSIKKIYHINYKQ